MHYLIFYAVDMLLWSAALILVLVLQWLTSPLSSHMLSQFEYRVDENLAEHVDLSEAEYRTEGEVADK